MRRNASARTSGVQRRRGLVLDGALVVGVGQQQVLVGEVEPPLGGPGNQDSADAGLPVDQGAVAVEAHGLKVVRSKLALIVGILPRVR